MSTDCDATRLSLGAYALGTLEPHDQQSVEAHLASCPVCLSEVDELGSVVPALASLGSEDLAPPSPSPQLFDRIAAAVGAAQAHPARVARHPRRLLLAVAASVAVLVGGGAAIGLAVSSSTPATTTASASAGPVHLAVTASDANPGTRLVLAVRGLPQNERCHLVALADDGTRHDAGTWTASYDGHATVTESTDVARSQLHRLTLYGPDGRQLVAVDL